MIETPSEFGERLKQLDPWADDFVIDADNLLEELSPQIADAVYPVIFEFFEAAPEADCGAPGSLVHHVEHFYPNYLGALKDSVRRAPSYNGVLMINRILNSELSSSEREELTEILVAIDANADAPQVVAEMAERFLTRQRKIHSEQASASDGDKPSI